MSDKRVNQLGQTETYVSLHVRLAVGELPVFKLALYRLELREVVDNIIKHVVTFRQELICGGDMLDRLTQYTEAPNRRGEGCASNIIFNRRGVSVEGGVHTGHL